MIDIPKKVAQPTVESNIIPPEVAEMPQEQEAPEAEPYVISFAKYNCKMCEVSLLNGNKAKKAIETFINIGLNVRSSSDFQRHSIDQIPVQYKGEYKKLFRGLDNDIDLKEIKLQQDARIFYFDIESNHTLYVVAIKQNHLETSKVRR